MKGSNIYGQLFSSFLRIGAFTFGGGWAMISLIEREVVDNKKWLDRTEFLDLLAVAQSLPGVLAVNISVAVGDKLRGMRGSVAAALGTITPCFLIILIIAMFLTPELIQNNAVISSIFRGIRPAVVALIVAPVITTARASKIGWKTVWIPIVVALLIWASWGWISNPILYIILGGVGGWLWLRAKTRREAETLMANGEVAPTSGEVAPSDESDGSDGSDQSDAAGNPTPAPQPEHPSELPVPQKPSKLTEPSSAASAAITASDPSDSSDSSDGTTSHTSSPNH